ncbi:Protein arginine N-methyltransferase 7 [Halotydeus destructor]|nr:Protein arginine N-methyltransferase 7 [Halotydeus destructor]
MEWVPQNDDYDFTQEIARSGYADMLHDEERNQLYNEAIKKTIKHLSNKKLPRPLKVVDIGTGTGLLSMMAVRAAEECDVRASVDAYECFEPMARCAEKVLEKNNCDKAVKVFHMRSDQRDIPVPEDGDLLITELFDTELIGEGAIGAYRHALTNLMKPNCLAVPYKARVWTQLISSSDIFKYNQVCSMLLAKGGKSINLVAPEEVTNCSGSNILHDVQLSQFKPGTDFRILSKPQLTFEFDFTKVEALPLRDSRCISYELIEDVEKEKLVILFWWDLLMDYEEDIVLSCAPFWAHPSGLQANALPWREHWIQAIYHLSASSSDFSGVKGGQLEIQASHDDYSFWFDRVSKEPPFCSCGIHLHISRQRMHMLNDDKRLQWQLDALKTLLIDDKPAKVMYIGDSSLLPLAVCKSRDNWEVHALCENQDSIDFFTNFSNVNDIKNFRLHDHIDEIPRNIKFDAVIAEPYFRTIDLPWDLLYFWYSIIRLPSELLSDKFQVLPNIVKIKTIPIQFDHLWKVRAPVGNTQGFDICHFDNLVLDASDASDELIESQPLWEYPGVSLAKTETTLFEWDFQTFKQLANSPVKFAKSDHSIMIEPNLKNKSSHLSLAFWIEFWFNDQIILNTGPVEEISQEGYCSWHRDWKQGVAFLNEKPKNSSLNLLAKFGFENGKLTLDIK